MLSRKIVMRVLSTLVLAAVVLGIGVIAVRTLERARAKTTTDRIRVLSTILLAERPPAITADVLATLTSQYKRSDVLLDGWGRKMAVYMDGEHYVVISFARDGAPSGCCVPSDQASPDTDLIAVDGKWRQVWN